MASASYPSSPRIWSVCSSSVGARWRKRPGVSDRSTGVGASGTAWAAEALDLDEHAVIKTLVMEDDRRAPLVVLMHGDREVSTRALARAIGAGGVRPCAPDVAERHSGYKVGGTSPLGLRKPLPIYMEASTAVGCSRRIRSAVSMPTR